MILLIGHGVAIGKNGTREMFNEKGYERKCSMLGRYLR
jgi:hypothetical protein